MRNAMTAHAWYRARGWIMQPVAVGLLALFMIGLTALTGIHRGMDHKVAFGPLSDQRAISIALSESVYGVHLGYVGLRSVQDKLLEIWNRGAKNPEDPILIENSSNADLVNEALRAAASLGPQKVGYLSDRSLMTTELDDMGDVDFYKLAFRLFGLQIQSYYYLFFALLAVSVVVFILTFHDDVYALVAMLCTLCAFYIALYLNDVFSISAPTFPGYRHGGTLALIPLWHFIFLMSRRRSVGVILGAVIQLAIMLFAYRIRGSVGWMFILLFTMAVVTALKHWLELTRADRSWSALVRAMAPWPVLLLVFGITANYGYTVFTLHPIYFTDDVLPYDGPWHCAYLGFEAAPGLLTPRGKAAMAYGSGDEFAAYGEYDYLDRTHFIPWDGSRQMPADAMSAWTGSDKARLKDDIMRRVVLEAIVRHPIEALVLYEYTKPISIFLVGDSIVVVRSHLRSCATGASCFDKRRCDAVFHAA
jgi:hypothetical protein